MLLPTEVEYLVIENLSDRPSLNACSLVCRSWRPVSQARLFRNVCLRVSSKTVCPVINGFIDHLVTSKHQPEADIGRYIHHLVIDGDDTLLHAEDIRTCILDVEVLDGSEDLYTPFLPPSSSSSILPWFDSRGSGWVDRLLDVFGSSPPEAPPEAGMAVVPVQEVGTVQHLGVDNINTGEAEYWKPFHARFPLTLLHSLLPLLPNLSTLALEGLRLCNDSSSVELPLVNTSTSALRRPLGNLCINACSSLTDDVLHLMQVVCMFSDLDMLYIESGPWRFRPPAPGTYVDHFPPPAFPVVRRLILEAFDDPECVNYLYDCVKSSGALDGTLRSLQFSGDTLKEVGMFLQFAAEVGPHLTELGLDISSAIVNIPDSFWTDIDLAFCPNLEKLTLFIDFGELTNAELPWDVLTVIHAAVQIYARMLSPRTAPRTLREVTFKVLYASVAPIMLQRQHNADTGGSGGEPVAPSGQWGSWAALDDALGALPALGSHSARAVRFELCDVYAADECKTVAVITGFVARQLPKMWEAGRVEILLEDTPVPRLSVMTEDYDRFEEW